MKSGLNSRVALIVNCLRFRYAPSGLLAVNVPNAETQQVFEETDAGINLNKAESVPDLFKQLGI
jgi:hypothetical protein